MYVIQMRSIMAKKTTKTEVKTDVPSYVRELNEKGVAVVYGRTRDELSEKLSAIPSDCAYYTGQVSYYYSTGLFRVQINKK